MEIGPNVNPKSVCDAIHIPAVILVNNTQYTLVITPILSMNKTTASVDGRRIVSSLSCIHGK